MDANVKSLVRSRPMVVLGLITTISLSFGVGFAQLPLSFWTRLGVFVIWALVVGWMWGAWMREQKESTRWVFGVSGALLGLGLIWTGLALFWFLTPTTALLGVWVVTCMGIVLDDRVISRCSKPQGGVWEKDASLVFFLIVLFGDAWFLTRWMVFATGEALVSPWQLANGAVFLLYGVTTFASIMFAVTRRGRLGLVVLAGHLLASLSVSVLVYGVGFGFDPFLHRAAEAALVHEGAIAPRRILYLGQYAFVSGMNLTTGVPITLIDKWLVPLLAGMGLPLLMNVLLRKGFQVSKRSSLLFSGATLLFPSMFLTFTVPFNLSLLLSFVGVWVMLLAWSPRRLVWVGLLGMFAVSVHPLGGIPLWLAMGFCLVRRLPFGKLRFLALWIMTGLSVLVIPGIFALHNVLGGFPPVSIQSHAWFRFLSLFQDPFPPGALPIPFSWEVLYDVMRWFPRVMLIGTGIFFWSRRGVIKTMGVEVWWLCGVLLGSVFLIASGFYFPDVIVYEQLEFASRLLQMIPFLLTPMVLAWLGQWWDERKRVTDVGEVVVAGALALAVTVSWYMSYPQLNPKARTYGASVSSADVETVRFIESRDDGEPFVVLSHQMTSAAAIQESGFRRYVATTEGLALWYPIPTGGKLYQYFLRMSTEGPSPELLEEIRLFTGVHHIYFVTYDSWPSAGFVRARAARFAQASYGVEGTKLVIYEYN